VREAKMIRTILICALLSGCATATKLNTGDGDIYRVECDGAAVPLSVCYKKANKLCAKGWDQLGADGTVIPQGTVTADYAYLGAIQQKSITVRCR
jgi:hypothetical protein